MNVRIESSWQQRLQSEFDKPYFENLTAFVRHEYATKTVYPPGSQIFAAFDACPFDPNASVGPCPEDIFRDGFED